MEARVFVVHRIRFTQRKPLTHQQKVRTRNERELGYMFGGSGTKALENQLLCAPAGSAAPIYFGPALSPTCAPPPRAP